VHVTPRGDHKTADSSFVAKVRRIINTMCHERYVNGQVAEALATFVMVLAVRAMLEALIIRQRGPHVLADLARGKMRSKISVLQEALTGHFRDHRRYLLAMMLDRIDALTARSTS
jgi:hypothetical protein